ncbi:uncharacterized protein TRAVEDRAFT_17521 [Trametes versicolor FP-101664 SS1]|uniref:uncharacterized protein n=1 Tax=Trametes versicolor (strain FP-101664) TaxID=717944 RepID=UPI0004623CE1|nr:uncharacterized protein TRAVEDRAFT_17521 [Trametes versicolor FP-101664 SS1]EIW63046.1 hypothetical protein TRAVEDRAFT_17521 [Trametes versicolor FP-101664 SS1]
MDAPKRKRDDDGTVVTFYTSNRTFQRVYKGQSLEETKTLVRTKLGLSEDASIRFSRLHEGRHIDLEDDDDFEAFRHLARYVTTLDVSVFIGNGEPPIFSQQPLAEAVSTSRKRQKAVGQRLSIAHSEPASGRSTPSSATAPRPSSSTLDGHGVPQKKRKRREEPQPRNKDASDAQSIQQEPEAGPSKPSKKNSGKHKSPAPVLGSKRKRHDSPEASAAPSDRPTTPPPPTLQPTSRPASPSYPTRKKQKKEKRSLPTDEAINTTDDSSAPSSKPDRKGKRKADAIAESAQSISRTTEVNEIHGGETADTEDNVLTDKPAKKAKGEKQDKDKKDKKKVVAEETPSTDLEEASAPSAESSKKKRKRRVTEGPIDVAVAPAAAVEVIDATAAQPESSKVTSSTDAPALKKDKKKSKKGKEVEKVAEPASLEEGPSPDGVATVEPAPSVVVKRKRTSKSKALESTNDSLEGSETTTLPIEASESGPSSFPEAVTQVQQKEKKKRRKTVSADTSVDPDASTVSSAAVLEADASQTAEAASSSVQSASIAKKRGRKKSVAPGPSQAAESSDSASAIAAIQAAVKAVLAKNMIAAAPPAPVPAAPEPAPAPAPEPVLPTRKRKAGKSKLRQAWGPEDISVDDQSSVSVAAIQETDLSLGQSATALSPGEPAQVVYKAAEGKKARPSSAPSCPICDKASVHSRAQCPVVKGGPEFIRKRIAQLQEEGHDDELIDELEVLLKEAQRRRKSAGDRLAPLQIPSVAATISEESTPSPVFPLSAASFAARPSPLPRVPAGSEISEVAVESKDEGSSNESSSSDEDEDAINSEAPKAASVPFASNSVRGADLGSIDLEALLRGPVKSHASVLSQIPSSSTTEDDGGSSDEDARQDSDVDLSEEDKDDLAYRRLSRKLERAAVSSSDEEHEPDAEAGDADADTEDSAADAQPEQEADVEGANDNDTEDTAVQDEQDEQLDAPDAKDATDQGYESDAEDVAAPQSPVREVEVLDQNSEESESETEEPSTHRGDGSRVEPTADVDESGSLSQEHPVQLAEETEAPELETGPAADDEASEDEDIRVEATEEANKNADEPASDDSASEDDEEVEKTTALTASAARALSPEAGEQQSNSNLEVEQEPERTPSPPPLQQPGPGFVHADVDMPADTSAHASSIDLHPGEDPSDPIESLGSFADVSERRRALDDDPIEDTDAENEAVQLQDTATRASAELAGLHEGTPPPAVHRTPGTVSRMKDRYGRLGHGSPSTMLPSLSQQLLGSLELPQLEVDVKMDADGDEEDAVPEQAHYDEDEPQQEAKAHEADDAEASSGHSQQTQDEEADEPQELETRPRRTTRVTRRVSAMTRSSSVPEPPASTPTPAPAPPSTAPAAAAAPKRRGRLTPEEKAAREAEKKAERDRKAAEKKAEREAKAAEKKAEKEAKEAAKRAEKEAKEAAKLAAKEEKEAPKRGKGRATRGKAASAKPISTRSRAAASVESDKPFEDEHAQEQDHDASGESSTAAAASTPGFSKVSWTTLPATQPRTQTESVADAESSMLDELQPSSPERSVARTSRSPEPISRTTNTTEKEEADVSREVTITQDRVAEEEDDSLPTMTPKPHGRGKEPLFIPSSSQYPNTPFPEDGLPESTPYGNGRALEDVSESDADVDEVPADLEGTVRKQAKGRPREWLTTAPYRRLSDIASQQLFPASQIPSPMLFPASQSQPRKSSAAYGRREEEDDDDDDESHDGSSSGSDSDAGKKKSHIPQERRAGAGVQKKKKTLLSYA